MKLLTNQTKYTINKKVYKGSDILDLVNNIANDLHNPNIKYFYNNKDLNKIKSVNNLEIPHATGREIAKLIHTNEDPINYIIESEIFNLYNNVLDLPKTLLLESYIDINKWKNNANRNAIEGPRLEQLSTYPNGDLFYMLSIFYNKGVNQIKDRTELEDFYNKNIEILKSIGFDCHIDEFHREGVSETLIKYGIRIKK